MIEPPQPPEGRRKVRIAMIVVPAVLTVGLTAAWFAILARTGGDLDIELGSRGGTPAWFSLIVVGVLVVGMGGFTVVGISTMRRLARTPLNDGLADTDHEGATSPQ